MFIFFEIGDRPADACDLDSPASVYDLRYRIERSIRRLCFGSEWNTSISPRHGEDRDIP